MVANSPKMTVPQPKLIRITKKVNLSVVLAMSIPPPKYPELPIQDFREWNVTTSPICDPSLLGHFDYKRLRSHSQSDMDQLGGRMKTPISDALTRLHLVAVHAFLRGCLKIKHLPI